MSEDTKIARRRTLSDSLNSLSSTGTESIKKDRQIRTTATPTLPGIEKLALEKIRMNQNMRLGDLVNELISESGYARDRVLQRLIELENNGKILVQERVPYRSLLDYAKSPLSLWFWGATFATLVSLSLVGVTAGAALYLRYFFGSLLILFLPGYSLVEFLYAKRKELDDITKVALSIGLSLAIVSLVGLVLNYTPFGIRLLPAVVSLAFFTIIFLVLALRRKHAYYRISKDVISSRGKEDIE
jgi:hypothetical protein